MEKTLSSLILLGCFAGICMASQQHAFSAGALTGVVWTPDNVEAISSLSPLVVFSHGWAGSATQSTYLCAALADAGYVVVAPNHADSLVGRDPQEMANDPRQANLPDRVAASFASPEDVHEAAVPRFFDYQNWTDASERGRADDVEAALNWALSERSFGFQVNPAQIALMGHSLGGYAVLGLVGGWPSWTDTRIRCVVALAPYTNPFVYHRTLMGVTVPVIFEVGTLDPGVYPYVTDTEGTFAQVAGPKYLLTLANSTHYAFTDMVADVHKDVIVRATTAFLDRYLKGMTDASILDEPGSDDEKMTAGK